MWFFAVFTLASSNPVGERSVRFEDEVFGPRLTLTCSWFTNFENSRFEQCESAMQKVLTEGDGASIKCVRDLCARLDVAARKAADWRKPEPPWGTFTVKLIGRLSLKPHNKRYLGDATQTVLVEELSSVGVVEPVR